MSQRNDDGDSGCGSLILLMIIIGLIVNQCSVDERLDKLEWKINYEVDDGRP